MHSKLPLSLAALALLLLAATPAALAGAVSTPGANSGGQEGTRAPHLPFTAPPFVSGFSEAPHAVFKLPQPGSTFPPGTTFPPSLPVGVIPPPGYVPGGVIPTGYTFPPIPDFGTDQPTVTGYTFAPNVPYHKGDRYDPDNSTGLNHCTVGLQSQTVQCISSKHQSFDQGLAGFKAAVTSAVQNNNLTALQPLLQTFFCNRARDAVAAMVACMPFPPCRGDDDDFVGKNFTVGFCDRDTNGTNSPLIFDFLGPNGTALANSMLGSSSVNHTRADFLSYFNCSVTTCQQDTVTAMNTLFSATTATATTGGSSSGMIATTSSLMLAVLTVVASGVA